MLRRNYNAFAIVIVTLQILTLSCKKSDRSFVHPDEGQPPILAASPEYITYRANGLESLHISFKYDEYPDKVSIYYDDTLTENKYDNIFAEYFFNGNGYLTGNRFYNPSGDIKSSLTFERDNDLIKHILIKHTDAGTEKTDTVSVTFSDSVSAPDHTLMEVDFGKYFYDIPVTMKFAYYNGSVVSSTAGLFTSGGNAVFFPSLVYTYNGLNQLQKKEADVYYGIEYFYEDGNGLDSLFRVLGGKDWVYLENILNYDENTSIFFYPLYITLSKANVDLDVYMQRFGPLTEVRSIPNGAEYPNAETFNFTNTYDEAKKLTQSIIYNEGQEYASYQFQY